MTVLYRVAWRGEEVRFDAEALARMTARWRGCAFRRRERRRGGLKRA
ncbi:MAG: hypothetical protein IH900_04805 [Proteobacteria bacterium]|nr:hypothetical protein [Pseudomonadota bacterium]MCH9011816.1 hypothetical protein [Pseudomonadota bacterium]